MLASGAGRRPAQPEPAGRASPDPSELRAPAGSFDDAPLGAVLRAVFRSHEGRVTLHALFDDAFERLVTDGRAAEYAPLVERYRLKYAAFDENDARCADRMRAISDGAGCAAMVDGIRRAESARLELHAEIQVLRQRRSLAAPDNPARAELDVRLTSRSIGRAPCLHLHAPAPRGGGPAAGSRHACRCMPLAAGSSLRDCGNARGARRAAMAEKEEEINEQLEELRCEAADCEE